MCDLYYHACHITHQTSDAIKQRILQAVNVGHFKNEILTVLARFIFLASLTTAAKVRR